MARCSVTIKAASNPSKRPAVIYFYVADAATETQIIATANAVASINNGTVTGISKQVYHNTDADGVGFEGASAKDNGGSDFDRVTCKNALGQTDQIQLPLLKQNVDNDGLEAIIEAAGAGDVLPLKNRFGEALGQVIAHRRSQVIDGSPDNP